MTPKLEPIAPEALTSMRERGGSWTVYENKAMDSSSRGHLQFLKVGPGCTFEEPPKKMPDTPRAINWMYCFVGYVDLETGAVKSG